MKSFFIGFLSLSIWLAGGCQPDYDPKALDQHMRDQLNTWNKKLTNVIIKDIFTPPVASRIYAYANVASYEVIAQADSNYLSLAGQVHGLQPIPEPNHEKPYHPQLAATYAFTLVGKALVFDKATMQEYIDEFLKEVRSLPSDPEIVESSLAYGQAVADHILAWAGEDGYKQREALTRYILLDDPGKWQPTPPDYMPAIEPHWNTLRTFVIDSATQFVPPPPTEFDTARTSLFWKEAMEVYDAVKNAGEEEVEIAKFWDCNPNISYTKGHVMFYAQKISPGGHWISIASIATDKADLPFNQRAHVFALTSISLADAFISCWDEKYRSSLIRPETYINRYYDKEWRPLLQTPAFPEYTSGHSVISRAAAEALTHLMGDSFAFVDSTEIDFGLPARSFDSFFDASNEAAISRLYGGIHYMPACANGIEQGKQVGQFVIDHLRFRIDEKEQLITKKNIE